MRILTKKEQTRFDALRERDYAGQATDEEKAEIERLSQKIIVAEEAYRAPATARMNAEADAAEARIGAMKAFNQRHRELVRKLEALISELQKEANALGDEWRRLQAKKPSAALSSRK